MKFKVANIGNVISKRTGHLGLKVRKVSPEIGMVVGTISVIGGVIGACKATTKLDEVLSEHKEKLDNIHIAIENPEELGLSREEYSEADGRRDLATTYLKISADMIKLYALPALSIALGLGCFYGSHRVLVKRNAALAAAYASVDKSFKQYRERVVNRFGKEVDKELRYNMRQETIEKVELDAKGKEKVVKETINVVSDDLNDYSEFARFFDSSCREWEDNSEYNLTFLMQMQARANDLLKSRKHVFLNEVYDMLGIPRTAAGQYVGWTYDSETGCSIGVDEDGDPVGDGKIDFGIYQSKRANRRFVNGYEPVILLDFNVDGNIMEMVDFH